MAQLLSVWIHVYNFTILIVHAVFSVHRSILALNKTSEDHQGHYELSSETMNKHFMVMDVTDVKMVQSKQKWKVDKQTLRARKANKMIQEIFFC